MNTNRRTFLKGAGVTLALPWLESFAAEKVNGIPQRLMIIGLPLGIHKEALVPTEAGKNYKTTEYLAHIEKFRNHFTIISGTDHPGIGGGHSAQPRLFTGQPSNKKNVRSLDQYVAGIVGKNTRYDSLVLSAGANDFSWTDGGSMVPPEKKMTKVFSKLFVDENASSKDRVLANINKGKSIMDFVLNDAKSLAPHMSKSDQNKLEEYYESVRATEKQLAKAESWVHKPKPVVKVPNNFKSDTQGSLLGQNFREVCDMTHLAFQTDSTRVVSCGYFRQGEVTVPGVKSPYHSLSHHGKDPENLRQLKEIEGMFFKELNMLLTKLKNSKEGNGTMLDNTTIIISSNLGNGNNHSTRDLPVLVAGGRFKHGQHLAFKEDEQPLSNLFLSVLHQMGIKDKSFGMSNGLLEGFDLV